MFNVANFFTASNLISGILAILFTLTGNLHYAPLAIFCGLVFDFLDGFMARLFKTQGELGKQLDSLADMVTFGVVPGVVMMEILSFIYLDDSLSYTPGTVYIREWLVNSFEFSDIESYLPFTGLIIPFFSLFRLAKFNLDTRQSESFIGLPTPSNTLFFVTYPALIFWSDLQGDESIFLLFFNRYVVVVLIMLLAFMMVSEIKLFSLKVKSFRWKGNEVRIVFLLISGIFILFFGVLSIALIVFLYIILSMIQNLSNKSINNKKTQDEV